ncbi:MAG: hypothetical protein JRH05_02840 [Deltaproteobacteria bacterium]|nr:hypothetical protein [Deltaproteobacteria bacterium]
MGTARHEPRGHQVRGSGGANDIACAAREIVVTASQRPGSFVSRVPYVTSPGERVRTLVSTLGVFKGAGRHDEFVLTGLIRNPGIRNRDEAISWEISDKSRPRATPGTPDERSCNGIRKRRKT